MKKRLFILILSVVLTFSVLPVTAGCQNYDDAALLAKIAELEQKLSDIQGEKGEKGDTGVTGPAGPQGEAGSVDWQNPIIMTADEFYNTVVNATAEDYYEKYYGKAVQITGTLSTFSSYTYCFDMAFQLSSGTLRCLFRPYKIYFSDLNGWTEGQQVTVRGIVGEEFDWFTPLMFTYVYRLIHCYPINE